MKQNNMTSFQYKVDESSGALPIDYSQQAATPILDCSRPTIDKFITSNPLFSKLFSWIRYSGEEDELAVLHKQQPFYYSNSIPIELSSFFKLFIKQKRSHVESSEISSGNVSKEWENNFCHTLYAKSLQEEANSSSSDYKGNDLFWTRLLYRNQAFKDYVSALLWKREYTWRTESLRKLAMQQPAEIQMDLLKGLIEYLDSQATWLLSNPQTQSTTTPPDFLASFPLEVMKEIRTKSKDSSPTSKVATYVLPDITLDSSPTSATLPELIGQHISLSSAFKMIKANKNPQQLQSIARQVYLDSISIPEKSDFQHLCDSLQMYTDAFTVDYSDKELMAEIKARCAAYFSTIFAPQPALTGLYSPDKVDAMTLSERSHLIEDFVLRQYTSFIANNRWGVDCMSTIASSLQFQATFNYLIKNASIIITDSNVQEFAIRQIVLFQKNLCSIWPFALNQPTDILYTMVPVETMHNMSSILAEMCSCAFDEFSIPENIRINKDGILKAWAAYNNLHRDFTDDHLFAGFRPEDFVLIQALFTCKVWETYQHVCDSAFKTIKALTAYTKENRK